MKKKHILQKKWIVCLLAVICCGLWGSAHSCIKIGYRLFAIGADETMVQILFAGCRFFLAGVLTILLGSILSRKCLIPQRRSAGKIIKLAMVQTVSQYVFFYIGLAHTTGVKSSIINGFNVFMSIFVAAVFFRQEKITRRKLLGCLLGFAGVVLVNVSGGSGFDMSMCLSGEGVLLLATVANAFSTVMIKIYSEEENPVVLSGYQFMFGGFIMAAAAYLTGARLAAPAQTLPAGVGMLVYLGFVSAVAYSVWGILLKYNEVSVVSVFSFMTPIFGVVLSALLLKERSALGVASITALLLICGGIYIVNKRGI